MKNPPQANAPQKPFLMFSTGAIHDTACGTAYFLAGEQVPALEQLRAGYTRPMMHALGTVSDTKLRNCEGVDYLACMRFVPSIRAGEPKKMESILLGGFPVVALSTQQKSGLLMFLQEALEHQAAGVKGHADLRKNDVRGSVELQGLLETLLPQLPQRTAQEAPARWRERASQPPSPAKGWFQL